MNTRIIVNTRYFSVAQPGQKADGKFILPKNAAASLVNYVATRETVSLNAPEYKYSPATLKQKETIKEIIKIMPQLKNTFEYEDYINNTTISNASELISKFSELNIESILSEDTAQNLVEYVAKRPGVFKVGEHGLFGAEDNINLEAVQNEISNHKGKIWTHVVSLHREDADKLGYDSQKLWKDAVKSQLPNIAKQHGIKPENLRWYAGMHNTGHHPHIHLFIYSSNPKEGYIDAKGIEKIKSGFSKVIFENEQIYSQEFYENKDSNRQAVKDKANEILENLPTSASEAFTPEQYAFIKDNILKLSDYLKNYKGRQIYAYINKEAKKLVDNIVDGLSECNDIKELYNLWCDDKLQQKLHYSKEKISLPKLSEAEDFKSIKNNIITYASKISKNVIPYDFGLGHMPQTENVINTEDINNNEEKSFEKEEQLATNINIKNDSSLDVYEQNHTQENTNLDEYDSSLDIETLENNSVISSLYFNMDYLKLTNAANNGDGKAAYKLGMMYLYGNQDKKLPIEKDYEKALQWFTIGSNSNESLCKYELGRMYLYGKGVEFDATVKKWGYELINTAYTEFKAQIFEAGQPIGELIEDGTAYKVDKYTGYLEYLCGRINYLGELSENSKDYSKAFLYFNAADFNDCTKAKYGLANMYYYGKGINPDYEKAFNLYKECAEYNSQKFIHATVKVAQMYKNGIGTEIDKMEAAKWYKLVAENGKASDWYRMAQIFDYGCGVNPDTQFANKYYSKALSAFIEAEKNEKDVVLKLKIADMYYKGKGTDVNKTEAAKWYKLAADNGNSHAMYKYAVMSELGEGIEANQILAQEYYKKALMIFETEYEVTQSPQLAYKIAMLYEFGKGTEQNIEKALDFYTKAVENGLDYAQKRIDVIQDYQQQTTANVAYDLFRLLATALHNNTGQSIYNISYKADSKVQRREKIEKMLAGQQADDYYDLDYYSKQQREQSL